MLIWFLALAGAIAAESSGPKTQAGRVDFNRDIRPILADNCYQCHGPDSAKRKAGLRLDLSEGALAKLESGHAAVVPGQPAKSRLIEVIASKDSDERMPPSRTGKTLSPEQIALLTRWIQEGAEWKPHWAYIAPEHTPVPAVSNPAWPRNEIDRFLLAGMDKEGLKPSGPADARTMIRRVTLDLTGLPPTIEEVDAFLADSGDAGYERLVDRLLASQAYGERMAVPWLDLARFADSDGYHADIPRSMWQYRDWVIQSFNRNQPFDQFVIDQLAGDLLPNPTLEQRIATAFNRNGMSSTEGGADPDEYMNKYVTDRVNTFGTVFLGSSIQCAECHSHKYDPFTQREYYQLYDFFNRIPERGLDSDPAPPFVKVPTESQAKSWETARLEVRVLGGVLEEKLGARHEQWDAAQAGWETTLESGLKASEGFALGDWSSVGPLGGADAKGAFKKEFGPEKAVDLNAKFEEGKAGWVSLKDWKDGVVQSLSGDPGATYLYRSITSTQARSITFYLGSDDALRVWLNGKELLSKDVSRGVAPNQDEVRADLKPGENQLVLKVVNYGGAAGVYFSTEKDAGDETLRKLRDIAKIPASMRTPEQASQLRRYYRENRVDEVKTVAAELAAAKKREGEIDKGIPTIRVMEDMKEGRPSHIRVRGDYRSRGEQVTADFPKSCLPPAKLAGSTNRLDLARWLVDPGHPLTARVAVNRFWGHFFPHPIVKTANEFGTNGELPSHPELLDWLARDFIEKGWNTKGLVKQMVMSAAYRQTSKVEADALAKDPQNRYLARGPRFRLSAEMVRDNALAISGLLVRKVGGPSVRPYQPPGLWEEKMFAGNKYEVGKGEELYRRSVYTLWKRTVPNPTLQTFDAPDRALCSVTRPTTCTPLQAFVTMNDVTYVESARVFAQRILRESPSKETAVRLDFAIKASLARRPTSQEVRVLSDVLADVERSYRSNARAADALTRLGESARPAGADPVELAAWTGVANVLLNLDESVSRE